jgi:hypothetical protein
MMNRQPRPELIRFLVELRAPVLGFHDLTDLSRRADSAARATDTPMEPVRFIRAVSVPADGSCLLVFEASGADAVESAARRAVLEYDRLTPVLTIAPGLDLAGSAVPDILPGE